MMETIDCEQGTPEWFAARLAIPTASMFKTVLAKGEGKTRKDYMLKLAGEAITGTSMENYTNANMERGKVMESDAREMYAFLNRGDDLKQVGFIRNGDTGCSPDRLIGANGMLEIKTTFPHILVELILKDKFPPEHAAQVQGGLWIAEREWCDLMVYWPAMPKFIKRAYRDEAYIKALSEAVDAFNAELAEIVAKVRGYGVPKPAPVRRHWSELSLPEQAGIRCTEMQFWRFMADRTGHGAIDGNDAADLVRHYCNVKSRAELGTDDAAAERWISLNREYENWKHGEPT